MHEEESQILHSTNYIESSNTKLDADGDFYHLLQGTTSVGCDIGHDGRGSVSGRQLSKTVNTIILRANHNNHDSKFVAGK